MPQGDRGVILFKLFGVLFMGATWGVGAMIVLEPEEKNFKWAVLASLCGAAAAWWVIAQWATKTRPAMLTAAAALAVEPLQPWPHPNLAF